MLVISGLKQMIARATRPPSRKPRRAHLGDDGTAALTERPPVAEPSAQLLLEGKEEAGSQGERGEPQRRQRRELFLAADGVRTDLEEQVGRHPGDEQGGGDGDRALGKRRPQKGCSGDGLGFGHGLHRLAMPW